MHQIKGVAAAILTSPHRQGRVHFEAERASGDRGLLLWRDASRCTSLANFYWALTMMFLWGCYHHVLGPHRLRRAIEASAQLPVFRLAAALTSARSDARFGQRTFQCRTSSAATTNATCPER